MNRLILLKYGELTTKKENRNLFITYLYNNIIKSINGEFEYRIVKNRVRMFIEVDDINLNKMIDKLGKIFGIYSIVICDKANNNIDAISIKIKEILEKKKFKTFKIETKRSNKSFPINSMEVSRKIGAYILKNLTCKVDVHNPDITVNIEIREDATYIYLNEIKDSHPIVPLILELIVLLLVI